MPGSGLEPNRQRDPVPVFLKRDQSIQYADPQAIRRMAVVEPNPI